MENDIVRFYARWKLEEGETLYALATDLQALAGLFTAAGHHGELEDLHAVYLDMMSAHRIDAHRLPTVFKLSKQSPLQVLLDIPAAWQVAGGLPVFAVLVEHAIGKGFDLIKQYWEIKKTKEEVRKLEMENAEKEAELAGKELRLEPSEFRYSDIANRLRRIEYVAFVQWDAFPEISPNTESEN